MTIRVVSEISGDARNAAEADIYPRVTMHEYTERTTIK
jgi:hypothetical protein